MRGVLWLAILAGLGYVGYYFYERSKSPPGTIKCPDPASSDFKTLLSKVSSGETKPDTAETMAKSYENAGCPDAAKAIRAAMPSPMAKAAPVPFVPLVAFGGMYSHELSSADVALKPTGFALLAGFSYVKDFLDANPQIKTTEIDAHIFPPDASDPAVFFSSKKSGDIDVPTWFRADPWSVGQVVKTKSNLSTKTSGVRTGSSQFDSRGCIAGTQQGWTDVWLGKPYSPPAGMDPAFLSGYAAGYDLAHTIPASSLTPGIPPYLIRKALALCAPTQRLSQAASPAAPSNGTPRSPAAPPPTSYSPARFQLLRRAA